MMNDVNWWLTALAFMVGMALTFALTIRRVQREVPVPAGLEPSDEPYGLGSTRVTPGSAPPAGYTVKGNEESMLYHTPESPSFHQSEGEIWFVDEDSALRAGFRSWHRGKRKRR